MRILSKNFDIVLLDADETVYDFRRAEKTAVSRTLDAFGIRPTDEVIALYSEGNLWCWKALERGEISREELKLRRFEMLFERIGAEPADFSAVNAMYEEELSHCAFLLPGAAAFVRKLHEEYDVRIYMATNGLTVPQTGRFRRSGIAPYVDGIYISEQVGFSKPDAAYFDCIFSDIGVTDRRRTIILGDSLTSDMQGGRNAGITTCRYLREGQPDGNPLCDYEITRYEDFFEILDGTPT